MVKKIYKVIKLIKRFFKSLGWLIKSILSSIAMIIEVNVLQVEWLTGAYQYMPTFLFGGFFIILTVWIIFKVVGR